MKSLWLNRIILYIHSHESPCLERVHISPAWTLVAPSFGHSVALNSKRKIEERFPRHFGRHVESCQENGLGEYQDFLDEFSTIFFWNAFIIIRLHCFALVLCFFAAAGERSGGCWPCVRAWSTTTQRLGKKVDVWIQQCLNMTTWFNQNLRDPYVINLALYHFTILVILWTQL